MEQKKEIHQVASGETLSSIATLEAVDLDALAKLNGIKNMNFIRKGQVLRLPPERLRDAPKAQPAKPAADASGKKPTVTPVSEQTEEWELFKVKMTTPWLDELLAKLHTEAANEHVQIAGQVPVPVQPTVPTYTPVPPQQSGSLTPQTIAQVKQAFKTKLGIEPHVIQFGGVKMTQNEKKQIVASVALCEMDSNGFSSINEDQEFVGRKYGKHGIETDTYSRIVHVGLSYGMIQFAQDVGALGKVLKKMRERNPSKFFDIFGGGDSGISDSLVTLTTTGRPDLANNAEIPLSGLDYWKTFMTTSEGLQITALANGPNQSNLPVSREIRGKRVQPLAPRAGAAPLDLWKGVWMERFKAAGNVLDFQEAQLEGAVSEYFDKILPRAKVNKVRSAISLGFIAACAIRGGQNSLLSRLFYRMALAIGITLPFTNSEDEKRCFDRIADTPLPPSNVSAVSIAGIMVSRIEIHRAKKLREDELGFLAEDLYDITTY